MAKKKYKPVEHDGTENRTDNPPPGDDPDVLPGNKVVHNVDEDKVKAFEAHVKEFEKAGKRKEMKAKNLPS